MEWIKRIFNGGRNFDGGKKGYSLLEVAAVIAIVGTLSGVIVPIVGDKIHETKVDGARIDVQTIRAGILSFYKDMGVPPFYRAGFSSLHPPREDGNGFYWVLKSDEGQDANAAPQAGWPTLSSSSVGSLNDQLLKNAVGYPAYGCPVGCSQIWNGPYLSRLHCDPWGNKYYVVIQWMANPVFVGEGCCGGYYQEKAAYVISAGPNRILDTDFRQVIKDVTASPGMYAFVVGGDDIVVPLR